MVIDATIDLTDPAETQCTFQTGATGQFESYNPLVFWKRASDADSSAGTVARWNRQLQVHAGRQADTRAVYGPDGQWGISSESGLDVATEANLSVAAFGVQRRSSDPPDTSPFRLRIECDDAFEISLRASRTGVSFDEDSMRGGGVGITANTLGTSIARDDRLERHFNTSLTRFEAITDIREESTSGNLTFHHPQGVEQWQLPVEPGIRHHRFAHTGGPGTYRLELDWSEHLAGDDLYGVLFGAEPVSSLDEIT